MIRNKAAFLRVGIMMVAGIAAAIGLLLFLSRGTVRNGFKVESYFRESVQGLDVGAAVKFRGVLLGQVTEISLASATYPEAMTAGREDNKFRLVVVRFTIDPLKVGRMPDPDRVIQNGLRSRLASQGITGVVYLELDFVNVGQFQAETVPWTPRDHYLPSMPSTIAQVQDAAQALLAKLQAVDLVRLAASMQTVFDDLHGQLTEGDVHIAVNEAKTLLTTLRAATERADLPAVAADLRAAAGSVRDLVRGPKVDGLLSASTRAADRFAEAARRLPPLLSALETAVKRVDNSVGDLQHDLAPILRDARAAASNLRETSDMLRQYPSSILLGAPPPREMRR